jgi:hypothetical protein
MTTLTTRGMNHLRIILDKSVVRGLNNDEVDSLDRYLLQIIPPILMNELLADLTRVADDDEAVKKLSRSSYRIGGNRQLTTDYKYLLQCSLVGSEGPMDRRPVPIGERVVRTTDGKLGVIVETPDEDEMIMRWERQEFTDEEHAQAAEFRKEYSRPIDYRFYVERLREVGIIYKPLEGDALFEFVESVLRERKIQGRLLALIQGEHGFTGEFMWRVFEHWYMAGAPMFEVYAPYAFFCLRASLIWALSSTTPGQNDRKDLEYLYYLPFTELFSTKDAKQERFARYLLRNDDQSFVPAEALKTDLARLAVEWTSLSREERIKTNAVRGTAPPENEDSLVFQLWKQFRGTINPNMMPVNPSPEFLEAIRKKFRELNAGEALSPSDVGSKQVARGTRTSRKTTERILKMFPQVNEEDLERKE